MSATPNPFGSVKSRLKQADIVASNPYAEKFFCIVKAREKLFAQILFLPRWSIPAYINVKCKQQLFMRWNEWADRNCKSSNSIWIFLTMEIVSHAFIVRFILFPFPSRSNPTTTLSCSINWARWNIQNGGRKNVVQRKGTRVSWGKPCHHQVNQRLERILRRLLPQKENMRT